MEGADAAYLCTTLNRAPAGRWAMAWDGGRYELKQGEAFAGGTHRPAAVLVHIPCRTRTLHVPRGWRARTWHY